MSLELPPHSLPIANYRSVPIFCRQALTLCVRNHLWQICIAISGWKGVQHCQEPSLQKRKNTYPRSFVEWL